MDAATDWVVSSGRYALDFDGSNDFVDITTTPNARFFASDFSINFAYNAATNTGGYRVMWETQGYRAMTGGLAIYQNNAQLEIWKHTSGVGFTNMINFAGGVGLNVWRYLSLVRQNEVLSLYTDGVLRGTFADTLNYDTGNTTNQINWGGGRTVFFFQGLMDSLMSHNRALSPSEIRLLASKRGIGLEPRKSKLLFHQFPSGAKRRLLLTGQT